MCGIVGYISNNNNHNSLDLGLESLKRLEYRGYDSAGLAYWTIMQRKLSITKRLAGSSPGTKNRQSHSISANPIILHTRWATHGKVTEANAHPHSTAKEISGSFITNNREL